MSRFIAPGLIHIRPQFRWRPSRCSVESLLVRLGKRDTLILQDDEKDLRNQGFGVVEQHGGASLPKGWIPKCGHRDEPVGAAFRRGSGNETEARAPGKLSRLEGAPNGWISCRERR